MTDTPAEVTVDILKPRFAAFTPLTTVDLPVDNIAGVPAQTGTLTAYGWNVLVRNLDVGRHVITTSVVVGRLQRVPSSTSSRSSRRRR